MMPRILLALGLCAATLSAQAFDFNKAMEKLNDPKVQKALSITQKVAEANREISEEEEIAIGDGVAARLLGAAPLVANAELQRYVNRVGLWLALQTERPALPWRFGVIDSPNVNAFATPGGTVLLTKGLYDQLRNEGELAGVLAHEISHVLQKHQLKAIQNTLGQEWKMELAQAVAEDKGTKKAEHWSRAFNAGTELFVRGLDKSDEFMADRMGMVIAARAGYNPFDLVSVLQTLGQLNPSDSSVALMFKTHPSPARRLDELDAQLGSRLDVYAEQVSTTRRFVSGNGKN